MCGLGVPAVLPDAAWPRMGVIPLEGILLVQHILRAEGFGVAFGEKIILAELTFRIPAHGITVLMGPSGTGKSTLVRALAGLSQANSRYREWGRVEFQGRALADGKRPALVVQNPRALSAKVADYLTQRCRKEDEHPSAGELRERLEALLRDFGCEDLQPWLQEQTVRLPSHLQRCVAILGELAAQPGLLMVDEPTSTLSDEAAERVMALLRSAAAVVPVLVVLHHQRQARALGQHLVLIAGGRVQAEQDLADFFTHPLTEVAQQFVLTGSCCVASPDAQIENLEDEAESPPPLPMVAQVATHLATSAAAPDAQPEYRGPRGFRWVLPGKMGTAPLPGVVLDIDLDLAALKQVGVTTLITLTKGDLPQEKLLQHGLRNLHLPIYDREAPSINQLRMLAIRMTRLLQQGEVLCVHCRAGLGRTGTVVAGWLIYEGLTASTALQRLRDIDKDYVQSSEQETFLHQLEASFLMKL
jgi:atypical dual specificity phosphatase